MSDIYALYITSLVKVNQANENTIEFY